MTYLPVVQYSPKEEKNIMLFLYLSNIATQLGIKPPKIKPVILESGTLDVTKHISDIESGVEELAHNLFVHYQGIAEQNEMFGRVWIGETTFGKMVDDLPEITLPGRLQYPNSFLRDNYIDERTKIDLALNPLKHFYEKPELINPIAIADQMAKIKKSNFYVTGAALSLVTAFDLFPNMSTGPLIMYVATMAVTLGITGLTWYKEPELQQRLLTEGTHQPLKEKAKIADTVIAFLHQPQDVISSSSPLMLEELLTEEQR